MSSLVNITRRAFGNAPERKGERDPKALGKNKLKDAYYGNVAGEILSQKHGANKLRDYLGDQGAVKEKGRYKRFDSASSQLLGGGG